MASQAHQLHASSYEVIRVPLFAFLFCLDRHVGSLYRGQTIFVGAELAYLGSNSVVLLLFLYTRLMNQ